MPLLGALAGCAATPQSRALLEQPPAAMASRAELEDVPFFPQERYQCGPAALATVLTEAGRPVRPEALVDEVYIPGREGSLRTELRAATRARALVPYPLEPALADLLREVAAGRPVLVMQNLGLDWFPKWHFAVVVGYDLEAGTVVLRSGTRRRRVTSMRVFERTWARSGRWAQVVVPADTPPVTATPLAWLRAVRELETGHPAVALRGYRVATEQWPDSGQAWMVLGNAEYAQDRPDAARRAFTRAIEAAPGAAAGWNNLAYALAATGCGDSARRAARCAVSLAPDEAGPRDTLDEMLERPAGEAGGQCGIPACPDAGANAP